MDLAVKYSDSISAVVIWGTTDDQSWRSAKLPVLFNEDYTAKPCYYSIIDGLTDTTTDTTTTTEQTTVTEPVETTTEQSQETTTATDETEPSVEETTVTTTDSIGDSGTYSLGDINHDGKVNASDLLKFKRYVLGMEDTIDIQVADMDSNQSVNVVDLLLLKKVILGII
jgi:endo-1,4-beta-xylanase